MQRLNRKTVPNKLRKTKIVQFGEGNFLRGFVDWILQKMNDTGLMDAGVAVVQPMRDGRVEALKEQDGLYTVVLQGIENDRLINENQIVDVITDLVNPYEDYSGFLALAENPDLQMIVSNTTEAGIAVDASDTDLSRCPESFPAKLVALLYRRFVCFGGAADKTVCIVPCELLDDNGGKLKQALLSVVERNGIEVGFTSWLLRCAFVNTLVDRIVPGYPTSETERLNAEWGYKDYSAVKGEIFHLWVLQNNEKLRAFFPGNKSGLNVVFCEDVQPYKERKVKILNGAHTALVPVAFLMGFDTVGEAVADADIFEFLKELLYDEIVPTVRLDTAQSNAFAASVLNRFSNPFIRHELMSIALNGLTKFKTRILPSIIDFTGATGKLPRLLAFAFAATVFMYSGKRGEEKITLKDNSEFLSRFERLWQEYPGGGEEMICTAAAWTDIFGQDLGLLHHDFCAFSGACLDKMLGYGMREALRWILK